MTISVDAVSEYAGLDMNGGLAFSNRLRTAAIFPSDVADDDHRQQIPLTLDEQQLAEASGEAYEDIIIIIIHSNSVFVLRLNHMILLQKPFGKAL